MSELRAACLICLMKRTLSDEEDIKKINKIFDLLDVEDDVQNVFHNWDE